MSSTLIARSPDLSRLRDEGYEVEVRDGHVLVNNVPYVTADRNIGRATMVIALTTAGNRTGEPPDHTVRWTGSMPHHHDGRQITRILAGSGAQQLGPGLITQHRFSSKPMPAGKYADYHAQFVGYIRIIAHEAQALDATATATTFAPLPTSEEESVFRYHDTNTSRAGIRMASAKLEVGKVAIVGVGGTGSYVLDLLAKTPVREIHLFDDDLFLNHNAFRAPGAASLEELQGQPYKVDYLISIYENMRRNLVPHRVRLDKDNAEAHIGQMDFIFLCIDSSPSTEALVQRIETLGVSFIDVGMGLDENEGSIGGILRVTTSTPDHRDHVWTQSRIPFDNADDGANEYARNIQVADLNALNACLAVIRWKKLCGFYRDFEREHHSLYTVDGNHLLNEDRA